MITGSSSVVIIIISIISISIISMIDLFAPSWTRRPAFESSHSGKTGPAPGRSELSKGISKWE